MNQIKWKRSLASEAVKLLGTNQNRPVNILDLEVVHLIAGGYGQGADASDYGKQQNGDDEQQSSGYGYRNRDYEYFSSLDKNFIELKATDVLLMTVKNYLEMFMGQKGLNCDVNSCKATCKVPKRNREVPIKREDENPSEYFCYPYELIYDHTHSIGCAVHFETKRKTELRGKLVCIMSTQHGHKKMLHHHNVFKVGSSCSNCERNFTCNAKSRLCVKRDEERRRPPNVRGAQRRQKCGV
uniref:Metalloprotease n=1 Tax=Globodera pallida TaxID=36090 RepID=A0A183CQT9_GLOPA